MELTTVYHPESRKQDKRCAACGHIFSSWGMKRDRCLQCDPIPPKLARIYRAQIDQDHEHVRL